MKKNSKLENLIKKLVKKSITNFVLCFHLLLQCILVFFSFEKKIEKRMNELSANVV